MAARNVQPFHGRYPNLDDKNFELHGRSLFILLFVLVFLIFFTILCLYIRWACHFPGWWAPYSPGSTDPSRPRGLNGRRLSPNGLDPKVICSLPVLLYRQVADDGRGAEGGRRRGSEDSMCSICLSVFTEGEKVKMLPKCSHTFHPECVDEWLKSQSSCPLCRSCIGQVQGIEAGDDMV